MKNKLSFLVISKEPWVQLRRARKQLLFEGLLEQALADEVLYVDPPRHRWQRPNQNQNMPVGMRRWQASLLLPGERFTWVRALNRWYIARALENQVSKRKCWYTVLYHPWDVALIPYLKKFGPVIFDWTEDWAVFHDNEDMRLAQEKAIRSATIVLAVTRELAKRAASLRGGTQDVLMLPNATALPLLNEDERPSIPDDISAIPEPRVGYAGHIGPWFNVDLVVSLASKRPDWNWVLVGYADQDKKEKLQALPNVHLIGEKPLSQLQPYLAHCQILVAPYKSSIQGDASKIYDYMTLCKPIVSSDIETARRFSEWVTIADGEENWIRAVSEGLNANREIDREKWERATLACSWSMRAKSLAQWLGSYGGVV